MNEHQPNQYDEQPTEISESAAFEERQDSTPASNPPEAETTTAPATEQRDSSTTTTSLPESEITDSPAVEQRPDNTTTSTLPAVEISDRSITETRQEQSTAADESQTEAVTEQPEQLPHTGADPIGLTTLGGAMLVAGAVAKKMVNRKK